LNLGTVLAGISIGSFVCGLTPFLAFLSETEKVPNPTNLTSSFFSREDETTYTKESMKSPASFFDASIFSATAEISSFLFIKTPPNKFY